MRDNKDECRGEYKQTFRPQRLSSDLLDRYRCLGNRNILGMD